MRDRTHYSTRQLSGTRGDDWRDRAACPDYDPELWFPHPGQDDVAEQAKAICRRCPVVDDCLRWALDTGQSYGVWGGLDEQQRRHARRHEPAAPTMTAQGPRPAPLHGQPWSAAEFERLQQLTDCGLPQEAIARAMDRSERSVRDALYRQRQRQRRKEGANA